MQFASLFLPKTNKNHEISFMVFLLVYFKAAVTSAKKESLSSDAPPTSAPSISLIDNSSSIFEGFTRATGGMDATEQL